MAPPTPSSSSKRRSLRVHKRDPIVAPGFGTQKDLTELSTTLGLPVPAVQAMMESRGRGIRGRSTESTEAPAASAAVPNAWADFLQDEGMSASNTATTDSTAKTPSSSSTTTAVDTSATNATPTGNRRKDSTGVASAPSDSEVPQTRVYKLPLQPSWKQTPSIDRSQPPLPKRSKVADDKPATGILVQTGTLDATMIGRTKRPLTQPYDLITPTILLKIPMVRVICSCNSAHAVAIDALGQPYGWGRNETQQLTAALPELVATPTLLTLPSTSTTTRVVDGAVGKSHTLLLTDQHQLFAVGSNKYGQCAIQSSVEAVPNFRKTKEISESILQVSCGEHFTVALTDQGHVYTCGASEFGQLGNGETGEYFISASKIAFANANVLTQRSFGNTDVRIGFVACGKHHTVALEAPSVDTTLIPRVYTWGCGDYGCLGHGIQTDEYSPKVVVTPNGMGVPVRAAAGSLCSLVLTERGHVYYWGRHRPVGEAIMRPTLLDALANNGHEVTHVSAGSQTVVCATANAVTVSWGQGLHGELGYGEKKSSSKPQFVSDLDKCRIQDLACGQGITLFLVKNDDKDDEEAIRQLKVLDPQDVTELETRSEQIKASKKRS